MAVIGGGITGAFSAYFLARAGARPVLVERDRIAAGASGANAGGLNPLHGPGIPGPLDALTLESLRLHLDSWSELRSLSGLDFGGRRVARLHVARDASQADELRRRAALFDGAPGLSARVLSAEQARAAEPMLGTELAGALWTEGNARVDPALYARAVVDAARRLGAEVVHADATGLDHARGRVHGVRLGSERLDCDGVVIATGPWCEAPQRWLAQPLPVAPVRGELLRVRPAVVPRAELTCGSVGVYLAAGDAVWLGGTEDGAGFDARPTGDGRRRVLAGVAGLVPGLGGAAVAEHTAALRPVTPDGLPIVGVPAGWENVCLALGGGRKGMLLSTGIAAAACRRLLDGRIGAALRPAAAPPPAGPREPALGRFSPARFACAPGSPARAGAGANR